MRCAETALYDLIESNEGCATVFAWLCWRKPNLADQRQGLKQKTISHMLTSGEMFGLRNICVMTKLPYR